MEAEKPRIDKYLWAIRIFKTRTQATDACNEGKVKLNGSSVKPSHRVAAGEQYDIKTPARKWLIEVVDVIQNRVAFPEAIKHYVDRTPEADQSSSHKLTESFYTGKRLSKTGRPSKKQRRGLNDFWDAPEPD